ncbi:MAG: tRNA lysidine(34) synthetase TilS [Chitinispirillaceae bacterium]|nr:tRNA lysidine(34) synthetase TilS [Chitinispirillaceae bacterium]
MLQDPILERVYLVCSPILRKKSSIIIGVSGGCDSVALLFILSQLVKKLEIDNLYVAHLNHGLRGEESDEEESLVKKHAETLGVKFFSKKISGHSLYESGLEEWARKERYAFFEEVKLQTGAEYIATGHTLDDQAETVLMRILRGCGLNGLRGIAQVRDGYIIRPILTIRKDELREWLKKEKIEYKEDSSNADLHFMRNKVRHIILPTLESCWSGAVIHLAQLANEAQTYWNSIEKGIKEWIDRNVIEISELSFWVRKEGLIEEEITLEALRQIFVSKGITPTRYHLQKIVKERVKTSGNFLLPKGWKYFIGKEFFYFKKAENSFMFVLKIPGTNEITQRNERIIIEEEKKIPENLKAGKNVIYIDGEKIGDKCYYRSIKKNDRFVPFGSQKEIEAVKFLSKQGVVKADLKEMGGIFTADDRLIWVPPVRSDERFRVTTTTKRVLKLQYERLI